MDRRCQYHIPRQVLGCERPDYPPRIWRRCRVRSRTESDADSRANNTGISESDACDAIGITDANADSRANSTGITESGAKSSSNPGADANADSGTHAGTEPCAHVGTEPNANACDANSGAIGISGSNPGTEPNTVDDSDSHSKANSGADSNRDSYSKADSVGISESVTGTVGDQEPEPCKLVPSPNEIKPAAQCRQQL